MIEINHISKFYSQPDLDYKLEILKDIQLKINALDSLAIVGPSGSGKSTLLNIIGTLDTPTSGDVIFDNQNISHLSQKALSQFRNQTIGFVFQQHHLLPQCTVFENVLLPTLPNKTVNQKDVQLRAEQLLERVGLSDRKNHRPGQLSGGECQRTAVVRALINKPKLLLADEPTGSLDSKTASEISQLLLEINQEEKVILLVVTHSFELAQKMNQVFELKKGQLKSDRIDPQ